MNDHSHETYRLEVFRDSMPPVAHCMKQFFPLVQLFAAVLFILHMTTELAAGSGQSQGTESMAERLRQIARAGRPGTNPFLNSAAAEMLRKQVNDMMAHPERRPPFSQIVKLCHNFALQSLRAGRWDEAIRGFRFVETILADGNAKLSAKQDLIMRHYLAVAHLRLGEMENLKINRTSAYSLAPIRKEGVHSNKQASQAAIQQLSEILRDYPEDLTSRWLLNLAYMNTGEYPDQVPETWLIPPEIFKSDYDIRLFPDIAGTLGLDIDGRAGSIVLDDFDGDHDLDLLISIRYLENQLRYFRNNSDGSFSELTSQTGLLGITGGLNMIQADYDNDGDLDVFVLRGGWLRDQGRHPNSLLRNNGDGTFDDETASAGLLSFHPTQTAAWLDYDNDGWIDLFIGNESNPNEIHPCELYHNNRDGTFVDVAPQSGVAIVSFVKAVGCGDYNNDGRPDLYLSCLKQPNILLRNDGPRTEGDEPVPIWRFTNVAREADVEEPDRSFPTWFWDYDNDGWLDIFVSGYGAKGIHEIAADYLGLPHGGEPPRLFRNNRDGTFSDVSRAAGLTKILVSMGANFGDLDNDGYLDFYVGTGDPDLRNVSPNRMFRNADGKFFQEVTTSGNFGHLQKGHGISFGDIDHDGDQDIYTVMGGAYECDHYLNSLFLNPGHGNAWITLKLVGDRSNRAAIGARIKVTVSTPLGPKDMYKTVNSGGSFGASPLRQEIGLGNAEAIEQLEITWPASDQKQIFREVPMRRFFRIEEGESTLMPLEVKSFELGTPMSK